MPPICIFDQRGDCDASEKCTEMRNRGDEVNCCTRCQSAIGIV